MKTKKEIPLYEREKGRKIDAHWEMKLTDRATRFVNITGRIDIALMLVFGVLTAIGRMSLGFTIFWCFASILGIMGIGLYMTVREHGSEDVKAELDQSKIVMKQDIDRRYSRFGESYDNTETEITGAGVGKILDERAANDGGVKSVL